MPKPNNFKPEDNPDFRENVIRMANMALGSNQLALKEKLLRLGQLEEVRVHMNVEGQRMRDTRGACGMPRLE